MIDTPIRTDPASLGDDADAFGAGIGSVELRDVQKRYGATVAVAGLSLRVGTGEFVTLLGPSGCGKTTTLRMIGGFERPDSGEVLIAGQAMGTTPPHKRPVNTVFQSFALFPHLSVGKNVAYGLEMARVPRAAQRQRVEAALEMVRLTQIEGRKPSELSGGQQQRVALARALVNRPTVLLLDEPLGALDLKLRQAMQRELKSLNREIEATFVYVTHDQEEALTMSDRIAVMNEGRILQIGPPAEIYERPRSRFVADFIGQTNFLPGTIREIRDGVAAVAVEGVGVVFATVPDPAVPVAGDAVSVAVRPEKVRIAWGSEAGSGINSLSGVLVEMLYLGTHSQYVVELPDGVRVSAHLQNDSGAAPAVAGGEQVTLTFPVAQTSVLVD